MNILVLPPSEQKLPNKLTFNVAVALPYPSGGWNNNLTETTSQPALDALEDHDFWSGLSSLVGNNVCYIAGFIVRKAIGRLDYTTCQEALISRQEPADFTCMITCSG